jgi:uncharacterized protein (TIGR02147 family)
MNTLETPVLKQPSIKRYSSVLTYLKDYYTFRKSSDPGFTQDLWSLELGFRSTSTMYLISSGRRPLTLKFIDTLAAALQLTEIEKNHLILLSSYSKTKSLSLKAVLFDKILENLDTNENIIDAKNYFQFVSSATMPIIVIALAFDDVKGTVSELSTILKLSSAKIKQDLIALEKMELVTQSFSESSEEAFWKPNSKDFRVPDDRSNNIMDLFHQRTLDEAGEALKQTDIFKRFRSVLFPINPEDHALLLSEIESFLTKMKNRFRQNTMSGKHIVKLNLNAYPVSQIK